MPDSAGHINGPERILSITRSALDSARNLVPVEIEVPGDLWPEIIELARLSGMTPQRYIAEAFLFFRRQEQQAGGSIEADLRTLAYEAERNPDLWALLHDMATMTRPPGQSWKEAA